MHDVILIPWGSMENQQNDEEFRPSQESTGYSEGKKKAKPVAQENTEFQREVFQGFVDDPQGLSGHSLRPVEHDEIQGTISTDCYLAAPPGYATPFVSNDNHAGLSCSDTQVVPAGRTLRNTSPNPSSRHSSAPTSPSEACPQLISCTSSPEMDFWNSVDGPPDKKDWINLKKRFAAYFAETTLLRDNGAYILQFIATVLKLDYSATSVQYCSLADFKRMVTWFAPFSVKDGGCFHKVYHLMKQSTNPVTRDGQTYNESYFAGYMLNAEATKRLLEKDVQGGSFLVRFSTRHADEGYFCLQVKSDCEGNEIAPFLIKRNNENMLFINDEREAFNSIPDLCNHFRDNTISEDFDTILANPCPDLPLNSLCSSYKNSLDAPGGSGVRRSAARDRGGSIGRTNAAGLNFKRGRGHLSKRAR